MKPRIDLCRRLYRGATSSQLLLYSTDSYGVYKLVNPFTGRERLLPVPAGIHVHEVDEPVHEEGVYLSEEMPVRTLQEN